MYITIGRNPQSDIVISGFDTVSFDHATIEYENGMFLFIDDSTNGTVVNGERINHESRPVREGDPILLAGVCTLDWNQVAAKVNMAQSNAYADMEESRTTQLHRQQPAPQQPIYQQPVYQQPVYQQPVYQQPQNEAPRQESQNNMNNGSALPAIVFVIGLAALGLALYPLIDYLSMGGGRDFSFFPLYLNFDSGKMIFLAASIVLGGTALVINHYDKSKSALSKAGIVLGIIGLVLSLLFLVWALVVRGKLS